LREDCVFGPFRFFGITASAVALLFLVSCKGHRKEAPAPPVVEVARVLQKDVPVYSEWIGTADGYVNAEIRAQVEGYLRSQNYTEGNFVKKGELLFVIDPRTFQAALDVARGRLKEAEAQEEKTALDVERYTPLAEESAISREELVDAEQAHKAATAAVASAKAAVEEAALNLGFTRITSPIDGIAGIATGQIGDLVGPATGNLTTVSTVDPIKVYISLSEKEYLGLTGKGDPHIDEIPLTLTLADGSVFPHKGRILFADREVNVQTGTIKVATVFENPGNVLRPGQFGRVRATMKKKSGALLVPLVAVSEFQGSYEVAVVGHDNKVDIRPVKVGEPAGSGLVVIDEGLKPGERVVAQGIQKLRQGMVVSPKPYASGGS
jgi:membrane fusion protein (multidrug efflux system)